MIRRLILVIASFIFAMNILYMIPGVHTPTSYFIYKFKPNERETMIIKQVYGSLSTVITTMVWSNLVFFALIVVLFFVTRDVRTTEKVSRGSAAERA